MKKSHIKQTSVAEIPSFLYFVFPRGSKRSEFIVIDGDRKIIKNLLHKLDCKYINKKDNVVSCKSNKLDSLLKSLYSLQDKRHLKFHYFNDKGKISKYQVKNNNNAKIYINDSKKPIILKVPSVDSKYNNKTNIKLKKNDSVKIVAKNVDNVARVAKLLKVRLCTFEDNDNEFVGIHTF